MRLLDDQIVLSPSDLSKFVRCAHATTLDLGRLRRTLKPFAQPQRGLHTDFIVRKGTEHEHDYVERLVRAGNQIITIHAERQTAEDLRNGEAATLDAMELDDLLRCRAFTGTGLRFLPVEHTANSQSSPEEAHRIGAEITALLARGTVTDCDGHTRPLTQRDIMVVAPTTPRSAA